MWPFLLVLGTLLVSWPRVASAQQVDVRTISFGIGGGVSIPFGATSDSYKTGFNGSASVRIDLGSLPWAVRAEFSYQNFELKPGVIPAAATPGGGTGTLLAGIGSAEFYLWRGNIRPYLLAGGGAYSVRTEYDAATPAAQSEVRLGVRGGAGVRLTFGSLLLYAEAGVDHIVPRSGSSGTDAIHVAPLTVGVVF